MNLPGKMRFHVLSPIVLLVIMLFMGCAPSVRYTRPSTKSKGSNTRASGKKENKNTEDKQNTTSKSIKNTQQNSFEKNTTNDNGPKDNRCGLRTTVEKYVGIPYKYGGVDRRGLDCSGLVYRVFKDLGYSDFVRTSSQVMFSMGTHVSKRKMIPGDLVFFKKRGKINHVGIYMGGREFAHSSSSIGVSYTTLDSDYFKNKFVGARRLYTCQ